MEKIYSWSEDMYPLVKKAFETRYASRMSAIGKVCGIVTQDAPTYTLPGLGGYGELSTYNGTLSRATSDNIFKKTITPAERALSVPVQFKDANIDVVTLANRTGIRLADSAFMTVLNEFYKVFGNAYSSAQGADNKPWAATNHPVSSATGSGTYSNLTTAALSVSSITEAIAAASNFVTADGMPFVGDFDMLFVSPELEERARKICGKDAAVSPLLDPETGVGANPVYGMNYMVVGAGSTGLTDKMWAIADSHLLSEVFKLVYVTEPTVLISPTENPLTAEFVAYVDFAFGHADARPIYFSDGSDDE
ncbi:MAG: hypothetical protein IKP68_04280 [Clostridia bacterium]|nr:hypothetical protein [Clostridia bacterium]